MDVNLLIARINELTRKERESRLEDWEKAEREALRQEYLLFIRAQVQTSLKGES